MSTDLLRAAIEGRHPLIYIHSAEEVRVLGLVHRLVAEVAPASAFTTWTCTLGLVSAPGAAPLPAGDTRDPLAAIQAVTAISGPGFYLFQDLTPFLDRPEVARALRDAHAVLMGRQDSALLMVSPVVQIPAALRQEVLLLELPLPDAHEIGERVCVLWSGYTSKVLPDDALEELTLALKGLTLDEVSHVMHRTLATGRLSRDGMLGEIAAAKKAAVSGAGFLDYVPDLVDLERIGGLTSLKDWIARRAALFNQRTVDSGLPVPKGLLLMGISGCGKSLCAKLIAHAWRVPLFRLDMNMIYADLHGNPQATFHKALRTIESVAPAVLWIDEIENGLGGSRGDGKGQGDAAAHILSAFLTWMQEKPPLVFVAATANRIEALPAEMIRKGRFDEVFFFDLPNDEERAAIFAVHIRNNRGDPATFDLDRLVRDSREWTAAEIEQIVVAGRIDSEQDRAPFGTEHIVAHARRLVPLSKSMNEQIRFIRDWAWDRATPASANPQVRFD
ncbi:AAA family ATPase [uncultured Thiodictyon sp.]|uniref:AAA family ATPase n=1 Tax=uncultured Thiodictyon sp. TaxID=1846217 RepID=UPI0025F0B975|nr:AAA family ATPase [uncultured Thiodictyon sp.]